MPTSLAFAPASGGLTIVAGAGGTYDSASITGLQITASGAVNLGDLLSASNLGGGTLSSLTILTPSTITFDPTTPTVTVASGATVNLSASSLVTKAAAPIILNAAGASNITVQTTGALAIGSGKGNLDLNLSGTSTISLTATAGTLTLNESGLTIGGGNISGASLAVNQTITSNNAFNVFATGKTGGITTGSKAEISVGESKT